jgi:hypothetical protein
MNQLFLFSSPFPLFDTRTKVVNPSFPALFGGSLSTHYHAHLVPGSGFLEIRIVRHYILDGVAKILIFLYVGSVSV